MYDFDYRYSHIGKLRYMHVHTHTTVAASIIFSRESEHYFSHYGIWDDGFIPTLNSHILVFWSFAGALSLPFLHFHFRFLASSLALYFTKQRSVVLSSASHYPKSQSRMEDPDRYELTLLHYN